MLEIKKEKDKETKTETDDKENSVPMLYANIPIKSMHKNQG